MATAKLTKKTVDALAARTEAYRVYDTALKGFSVRVAPSGEKTWLVEYRPYPGGRGVAKRRMSLGSTAGLTPDEAGDEARDILASVAKGGDPAKSRNDRRKEMKLADLIELYEHEGCYVLRGKRKGEPMKPTTKAFTLARLRHHVVPLLGAKRVTEVTAGDIQRMARDIANGKTAKDEKKKGRRIIVRGGPGAARKVVRDLSALYTFATFSRLATGNPCDTANVRKTDNKRDRYLSLDEVRRLGAALEELAGEGVNTKALDIARLWALTGCRRNEIAALRWMEIDFEHSCLRLADSKTGSSVRPLAAPATMLLSSITREEGSPYVFPATRGGGFFQGTKRVWPKVIDRAQLLGVTPHTLRHTLGSSAVSVGETLVMTGAILGHREARSTSIYAHVQQDPAARAAERAVKPIAAALSGKPLAEGASGVGIESRGIGRPSDKLASACRLPLRPSRRIARRAMKRYVESIWDRPVDWPAFDPPGLIFVARAGGRVGAYLFPCEWTEPGTVARHSDAYRSVLQRRDKVRLALAEHFACSRLHAFILTHRGLDSWPAQRWYASARAVKWLTACTVPSTDAFPGGFHPLADVLEFQLFVEQQGLEGLLAGNADFNGTPHHDAADDEAGELIAGESQDKQLIANDTEGMGRNRRRKRKRPQQFRAAAKIAELWPDGPPPPEKMTDTAFVKKVQEGFPRKDGEPPSPDSILRAARRRP